MKKITLLLILLTLLIINLSAVSAADTINNTISDENDLDDVQHDMNTIKVENKTFEDINYAIEKSNDGDIIELEGNYTGSGQPIYGSKSLTLVGVGEGATLDAKNLSDIFKCYADTTLKNIKFINANSKSESASARGACIYVGEMINMNIINCSFISTESSYPIYTKGNLTMADCLFSNNRGGIFADSGLLSIDNTTFLNNTAASQRSIFAIYTKFCMVTIQNSKFINNSAAPMSATISASGSKARIVNSYFEESFRSTPDNVIYGDIMNCTFKNIRIAHGCDNSTISNNRFYDSTLQLYSSCIASDNQFDNSSLSPTGDGICVMNSTFKNYEGYTIVPLNNTQIIGCDFTNLTYGVYLFNTNPGKYDLTALNCKFENISKAGILSQQDSNQINVGNCTFKNITTAIQVGAKRIQISDSSFSNVDRYGIIIKGDYADIGNCSFESGFNEYCIKLTSTELALPLKNACITDCVFKDIEGRAINGYASNITVANCKIGASVDIYANMSNIINSSFSNFQSHAITVNDAYDAICNIIGCNFTGITCQNNWEGIIKIYQGKQIQIINSNFINNALTENLICSYHKQTSLAVDNSTFINNTSNDPCAAIRTSSKTKITDSLFKDNMLPNGHAIVFEVDEGSMIENCRFINNTVKNNMAVEGFYDYEITQTGSYFGNIIINIKIIDKLTGKSINHSELRFGLTKSVRESFMDVSEGEKIMDSVFKTQENNITSIEMHSLKVGKYKGYVYDDSIWAMERFEINVEKAPAKIIASKLTTAYSPDKYYTVKILNSKTNKAMPNVKVTLTSNGKKIIATTDKNGQAKFSLSKFSSGLQNIKISISDSNVNGKQVTSSIKINKAKTIVSAPKVTFKVKKSKYFKVTVKTTNKKAVKNTYIKLKIDKKTYKIKTNSKGIAQFNTKSLKIGKHQVTISSGDSRLTINAKSTITIKK